MEFLFFIVFSVGLIAFLVWDGRRLNRTPPPPPRSAKQENAASEARLFKVAI